MTREQRMSIVSVPSDGDCFYHAFISGLGIAASPTDLRNFVASKIEQCPDLYTDMIDDWKGFGLIKGDGDGDGVPSADELARRIRHDKEWATTTVIHILSDAFNVRTVVYKKVGSRCLPQIFPYPWTFDPKQRKFARTIHIYHHDCHFDLLLPIGPPNEAGAEDGSIELNEHVQCKEQQLGGNASTAVQWEPNAGQPTEPNALSFLFGVTIILTLLTYL